MHFIDGKARKTKHAGWQGTDKAESKFRLWSSDSRQTGTGWIQISGCNHAIDSRQTGRDRWVAWKEKRRETRQSGRETWVKDVLLKVISGTREAGEWVGLTRVIGLIFCATCIPGKNCQALTTTANKH